jgi:hypothetical protein
MLELVSSPLISVYSFYSSMTLTSNVWLLDAPIESVRSICIVYFPASSEFMGLMMNLREVGSKVMNDGSTESDF